MVAIADQAAGHRLGYLNPTLYALAAEGAPGLTDVTIGNNAVTFAQNGKTYTVPGYRRGPATTWPAGSARSTGPSWYRSWRPPAEVTHPA